RIIMAAQGLVLVSETTVLVLYVTGHLQFWHLVGAAFVMGCVFPLMMPARQAIVANVVGRERLSSAIALNMTGVNTARVVGPAPRGVLVLGDDVRLAYVAGIAMYVTALLCMWKIGPLHPQGGARNSPMWSNVVE